jgi:Tfp pilus assembly protein PilZ
MSFTSENRTAPRKLCLISISWSDKDNIITHYIKNISSTGVLIETTEPFEIGQEISIRILAPSNLQTDNHFNGTVVRSDSEGIGVQFTREDDLQIATIENLIQKI